MFEYLVKVFLAPIILIKVFVRGIISVGTLKLVDKTLVTVKEIFKLKQLGISIGT